MKVIKKIDEKMVFSVNENPVKKALKDIDPKAIANFLGQHHAEGQGTQCWNVSVWGACGV